MATGTFLWYGNAFKAAFNKEIDFNTDVVRMALANSSYTPDQDAHDYFNDVRANEVTGTNWAADGVQLTTPTVTYTGGTNVTKFDADDVSVSTVTLSDGKHSIFYVDTGTDSTSALIGYITWDTALAPSAGTLSVTFNAAGIATITAS